MAATAIEVIVTARDDATRVLQSVKQQLEIFPEFARTATVLGASVDRTNRSLEGLELSTSKAARGIRSLVAPIVSELSPALGHTASQLASVVTTAAVLGTGFGAVAIAGSALAGILGGKLLQSWQESAAAAEAYQRAVRVGDLQAISTAISRQADEVLKLGRAHREAEAEAARARTQARGLGPDAGGVAGAIGMGAGQAERAAEVARRRLLAQQRDLELAQQARAEGESLLRSEQALLQIEEDRAKLRAANVLADRALYDFRLDPIAQQFEQQRRAADERAALGDPAGAARLRGAAAAQRTMALGQRFAATAPVSPFETIEGQEAERRAREAGLLADEAERQARIQEFQTGAPVNPFESAGGQEAERRAIEQALLRQAAEEEQLAARRIIANVQLLDITRQRAEILGEITPQLNAQLILMERNLLLEQAGLRTEEQAMATAEGRTIIARANLALLEQQARLDPLAGLTRGFSEAANASREWGTEMLQVARETDRNMSRTFSDGLFNLFTGRKGQDIGKQFAESLLRSLTDVVGRQLSGAVSGVFAGALQGFRGVMPGAVGGGGAGFDLLSLFGAGGGGGPIISPTGAPSGSLIMTQGGLAQVTPTGALQLVQGGGGGGGLDYVSTGISGVGTLSNAYAGLGVLATNFAVGGVQGALLGLEGVTIISASGAAANIVVPAGTAGYAAAELGAIGGSTAVGTGTSGLVGAGGSAFASTAGAATAGILAAVALGFTIYSGLNQPATAQNIAINAVSGAVSGAIVGGSIGFIVGNVPGLIIGAAIGAIVGGAAAGGTTGLKAPKKKGPGDRSRELSTRAADNLSAAIDTATSIEDLVTIFNTRWAPHGELQIWTHYAGALYWAGDELSPPGQMATPELMLIPEFLDALGIAVGESGTVYVERGRPEIRQDLIDKFRTKRDELLATYQEIPFAIQEQDIRAGVGRRTYLPFSQLYSLQPGRNQLLYSSEVFRRDLAGDDATVAFIIQRINEVGNKRDMDVTRRDFLFGLGGV